MVQATHGWLSVLFSVFPSQLGTPAHQSRNAHSSPSLLLLEQKHMLIVNRRRKTIADREDPHRQESLRHQAIEDLTDNTLGMHR
jgi:hypothetical protein